MQSLSDFSPWTLTDTNDLRSKFVLVVERESVFGEFAWTMLLVKALRLGCQLRIVSLTHTRAHFTSILRKQGVDSDRHEADGHLKLFNLQSVNALNPSIWHELCEFVMADVNEKVVLCFDSVDVLDLIAPSHRASQQLLADCCSKIYNSMVCYSFLSRFLIVFQMHSMIVLGKDFEDNEVDETGLMEFCKYRCSQLVIDIHEMIFNIEQRLQLLCSHCSRATRQMSEDR